MNHQAPYNWQTESSEPSQTFLLQFYSVSVCIYIFFLLNIRWIKCFEKRQAGGHYDLPKPCSRTRWFGWHLSSGYWTIKQMLFLLILSFGPKLSWLASFGNFFKDLISFDVADDGDLLFLDVHIGRHHTCTTRKRTHVKRKKIKTINTWKRLTRTIIPPTILYHNPPTPSGASNYILFTPLLQVHTPFWSKKTFEFPLSSHQACPHSSKWIRRCSVRASFPSSCTTNR